MMNLRSVRPACASTHTSLAFTARPLWHVLVQCALAATTAATGNALNGPASALSTNVIRACEGETAGKSPLQVALRHYIKAADPIPRRFLSVVGTDTAVSESGMKVLAEFGPTYFYTGSDAVKAKLKDNLERIGPYPALLIVVRSNRKVNATTQSVRVGGHYIAGEFDGKVAISRAYTLVCAATGWVVKDAKEEPAQ